MKYFRKHPTWTVYGKVAQVSKKVTDSKGVHFVSIVYQYDGGGNRVQKTVQKGEFISVTQYVRDSSGNILATYDNSHQVEEFNIYGSSRLGSYKPEYEEDAQNSEEKNRVEDYGKLILGYRNYELTNHLGNVLVVVSDKKVFENNEFMPYVISANDYYPFGMTIKSRSFDGNYRFGFNGKENDTDFGEGIQDYGARIYDFETGRWLSRDPHEGNYPSLTPYNFVGNMPLSAIDPDGKDIIILADKHGAGGTGHRAVLISTADGGWIYMSKDGASESGVVGEGHFGSESRFTIIRFESIEAFVNSPHNFELKDGHYHSSDENSTGKNGTHGKGKITEDLYNRDEHGNRIQRYDAAFYIPTEESSNKEMRAAAQEVLEENYCLGFSDCSDVGTGALSKGVDKNGEPLKTGDPTTQYSSTPNSFWEALNTTIAGVEGEVAPPRYDGYGGINDRAYMGHYWGRILGTIVNEAEKDYPNNKYDNIRKENAEVGYDIDMDIVPREILNYRNKYMKQVEQRLKKWEQSASDATRVQH